MGNIISAFIGLLPVIIPAVLIIIFIWLVLIIAGTIKNGRVSPKRGSVFVPVDSDCAHAAESLSSVLRYKTVSHLNRDNMEYTEFEKLRDYLRRRYPNAHKVMARETVGYSIVYRWAAQPRSVGKPILLCGHLDVVPAEGEWLHDPFSGEIYDGFVWGRGSLDCKHIVICIMEAIEQLAESGFAPERDIYITFGHDEEIGGPEGAGAIAHLLRGEGIEFEMVIDEGMPLLRGVMGIKAPVALVGVSEKGNMNIKLTAKSDGGHASVPPDHTALGLVSEAICRLEFKPRSARMNPVIEEHLRLLAPLLPFREKIMVSNLWFFRRKLLKLLSKDPVTNALIRTTSAATMSRAGAAANVLPRKAEAIVNFRTAHGDKCDDIISYVKDLTRDLGLSVDATRRENASALSNYKNKPFAVLSETIQEVFGKVIVSPYIMHFATDSRKYEEFCDSVYRFCPIVLTKSESALMHSANERISVTSLGCAVEFYKKLIIKTTGRDIPVSAAPKTGDEIKSTGE